MRARPKTIRALLIAGVAARWLRPRNWAHWPTAISHFDSTI